MPGQPSRGCRAFRALRPSPAETSFPAPSAPGSTHRGSSSLRPYICPFFTDAELSSGWQWRGQRRRMRLDVRESLLLVHGICTDYGAQNIGILCRVNGPVRWVSNLVQPLGWGRPSRNKSAPRRLKPHPSVEFCGTAEAVPFKQSGSGSRAVQA